MHVWFNLEYAPPGVVLFHDVGLDFSVYASIILKDEEWIGLCDPQ
jgi:hypothetical protein